jgi:hypothetical protein
VCAVQGSRICTPAAAQLERGTPVSTGFALAPSRGREHDPPLLTWPNWDLHRFDIGWRWQREAIGDYFAWCDVT